MNNKTSRNLPAEIDPIDPNINSVWQLAQLRFNALRRNALARQEMLIVILLFVLTFGIPYLTWFRRWTLNGSPQSYAVFILPLALVWVWLARLRLVAPEIEAIRRLLKKQREKGTVNPADEKEVSVLQVLRDNQPLEIKHPLWPLIVAALVDCIAFWIRDPSFTCLGFIVTLAGVIAYRQGTFALRTAAFPMFLLLTMIPLPGILLDTVQNRAQILILSPVQHMMTNAGIQIDLAAEGDPLRVSVNLQIVYQFFVDKAGLGLSESILVLLITLTYLTLIRTQNVLPKIYVMIFTGAWMVMLIVLRLVLLCWIATVDRDTADFLELMTRLLLPVLGLAGAYSLTRGFRCIKFHRWAPELSPS